MGRNNQQRRRAKAQARRAARSPGRTHQPAGPDDQLAEHRVGGLITSAVDALDRKRKEEFDSVTRTLSELSGERSARRVATRILRQMLRGHVTEAWHRGWQPADQNYPEARRRSADHLPQGVIAGAVKAMHLLLTLPRLERLGPLPGTAVPPSAPPRPAGSADADERILSRVRALLAKAESTTFEAEAETFTAGAQALMARHSIDTALLAASHEGSEGAPEGRRIGIDNPYEAPKVALLGAVADANRCRTVWSAKLAFIAVVGFRTDVDAVETLFTSLLVQATRAMTREGSRTDRFGRSPTRAFRQSFLSAYAARIGERLDEVSRDETEAAARSASRAGGAELVPLLKARSAAVDEALEAMFPDLVTRSLGSVTDAEGWHSGRTAADLATIGGGRQVEDGGART